MCTCGVISQIVHPPALEQEDREDPGIGSGEDGLGDTEIEIWRLDIEIEIEIERERERESESVFYFVFMRYVCMQGEIFSKLVHARACERVKDG